MKQVNIKSLKRAWPEFEELLSSYKTKKSYLKALEILDLLVDETGGNEKHPLSSLVETIGLLVEHYENQHLEDISSNPIYVLKFLMEEHGLKQSDLKEIGSQGVVSEVLAGRRELNKRQIMALSSRFSVSPTVFLENPSNEKQAA